MRTLVARERKLVALLILVALVAGFQLIVVGPIMSGFSDRAASKEALLLQYQVNQRQIGAIPRLRRQAEQQQRDAREFVLAAASPELASAALQDRLQKSVEAVGGELRGTEDVIGEDGLARARATAQLSLEQITGLLARLQNERPYATVEALTIAADQAVISGRLEPMDVSLEISIPIARTSAR
jgi:general secretion pathway protein M